MAKKKPAAKPAPKASAASKVSDLLEKLRKLERYRKAAKTNYAAADRVSEELIAVLKGRKPIELGDGRTVRLVDAFADKNKAFKTQFFSRYDVVIQ